MHSLQFNTEHSHRKFKVTLLPVSPGAKSFTLSATEVLILCNIYSFSVRLTSLDIDAVSNLIAAYFTIKCNYYLQQF